MTNQYTASPNTSPRTGKHIEQQKHQHTATSNTSQTTWNHNGPLTSMMSQRPNGAFSLAFIYVKVL